MINPFGMTRALIPSVALILVLGSCTQRLICPAYQSAFIYDKPTQREKFVYYNENPTQPREVLASNSKTITLPPRDSTWLKSDAMKGPALPQVRRSKKGRYLLLPEKTYKQALRSLRTVEMKPVYPKKPDSLDIKSELDSAARSITDTLTAQDATPKPAVDSVYAITKTKEKYNMDQDIYMWYFRDVLVLPDVRAAMMEEGAAKASSKKSSKKAKGGFFKNFFKKKNKKDSTSLDVVDESVVSDSTAAKPKKKSLGGLFKKKPKVESTDPTKKTDPAKKEEDDGF